MSVAAPRVNLERLCWTAGCLLLALLPHLKSLPGWITATIAVATGIRLTLAWMGRGLPPAFLRLAVSATAIALLFMQFRTFNGIDAGTALLSLMAGLKLLEARGLRDIRIIVLIVYFLSLTALLTGTSFVLLFYLLAVCWLTTAVLLRLTLLEPAPRLRDSLQFSARLLLLALPLAAALWLFFPRFSGPLWHLPVPESAAQSGLGERMSPGDLSELSLSDEVAFRVRFAGAVPPPNQRYWRGPVLENFDGRSWSRNESAADSAPPPRPLGYAYHYTLSLETHRHSWLLALDWPSQWDAPRAYLTQTRELAQPDPVNRPMDFNAVSHTQIEQESQLDPRRRRRDTRLPPQRNPRTLALALQLRASSASDAEFAQAALQLFRRDAFYYTLTPPRLASDAVDEFLFDTKRGFCEHYASAYAALLRAGGVPARVVTGYQGGTYNRFAGYWIVRQSDAHAWNEIWLEGRGWVRADPTAAIAPERIERGSAGLYDTDLAADTWSPLFADWRLRLDALRQIWREAILRFDQQAQMNLLQSLHIPQPNAQKLALLLAAALAITSVWLSWQLQRGLRARKVDAAAAAFARLRRKLHARGIAERPAETALELAARVSALRPDLALTFSELCGQYNVLRYGRGAPAAGDLRRFVAAVRRFKA